MTIQSTITFQPLWDRPAGAKRVERLFVEHFGESPKGIWSAPGRVNLIGEHTDYNGGLALPIALPHRTFAAYRPRQDRLVRLISAQEENVRTVDLDQVGPAGSDKAVEGWPAYVVGVAWAMEQDSDARLPGFDIAIDSCVPYGAGLSSSAALEGAAVMAFVDELAGDSAPDWDDEQRTDMVGWCIRAENEVAGAPTGGMDQSASLRCQDGHAIALDCNDNSVQQVPFDLAALGMKLLVIDTKAPHALVDGQYGQRRRSCEEAATNLGVANLAQITDLEGALARLDNPIHRARVRHVVTEIERTKRTIALLSQPDVSDEVMAEVGRLFTESHASLRDDYEVTCPELDLAVEVALHQGALGARMTGGGFGGSAIALVSDANVDSTAVAISEAFAAAGFNAPVFLVAHPAESAGRDLR